MPNLDFSEKIKDNTKDINSLEQVLGKSLKQPFTNTNSGVIMLSIYGNMCVHKG